ncbi:MAG: right-handed parallel beta-helix repeat-containing protein [Prolixibacteraceae bacterium]|nr:right-handed parallel beta-helix repeat-containing protein [Prolixibacteraceae bacterium]
MKPVSLSSIKATGLTLFFIFISFLIWASFPNGANPNPGLPEDQLTGIAAPYTENFDGVTTPALPAGWSTIALPQPGATPAQTLVRAWAPSPSNLVELLNNSAGDESDLLLISPELENINQSMILFHAGTSSTQGSPTLIIGTMSNPADPSTFVEIRSISNLSYVELNPHLVGLPNAPANARHIAFRHGNANLGDFRSIYIDNFVFETLPACAEPSGLEGSGMSNNTATLRWDENGTATRWEVKYDLSGFNPDIQGTVFTVIDQSTCSLNGLITSSEYDFYVRAVCSETEKSPWAGPALFRTTQIPLAAPFTENFETETAQGWDMVNGDFINQWYVGSATAFEGNQSAYISNNGGVTNEYTLTPPSTMRVHLFRDITFPATPGLYTLKYWVKGVMEASDYLRVHFMETSVVPVAGEFLPLLYYIGEGQVTNNATWTEKTIQLPEGLEGQTRRLVFTWTCNTRNGTQPPTAIDNVQILFEAFGTISGTALEPGGQPAAGARIIAGDFSGTANEEGEFQITGLPSATYDVRAEAGGLATVFGSVDVGVGSTADFDVQFEHEHNFLPQGLSRHSEIPGDEGFQHSATDGRYLYSPDFNNTLHIYDLLDPANPVEAGTKTITNIGGAFYGQNLFVGSLSDRLEIFDCTNPASLLPLSTWFIYGNAKDMAFNGNHAFVVASQPGTQSILRVADCSDPTDVNEVSGTILSFGSWAKMEIDHDRNLLYLLGVQDDFNALFYIFDISNPASPNQQYMAFLSDNVQGMVLSEGHVIITYNHNELAAPPAASDGSAPLTAPQGGQMRGYFNVWDTQNPSSPQIILTQALEIMAYILETSFFNGTLFAYLMPENSAQLILATFYFNATMNTMFQGISLNAEIWENNQLTFMQEPIQQLKSQSMVNEDPLYETFYAIAAGQNPGMSSPPQTVIKVTRNPGEQHTLTMSINPAEAAADGCTVTPGAGVHTFSEVTSVPLSYTNSENWVFKEWQGPAVGNNVEVNGNVAVAGVFVPMPVLTVSGKKEKEVICPVELENYIDEGYYAGMIQFRADENDDWKVQGINLEASGTANDRYDISKVEIHWDGNIFSGRYDANNGSLEVDFEPSITVPKGSWVTADVYYYFYDFPDDYASDSVLSFLWKTEHTRAIPVTYLPGIIVGKAKMDSLLVARVHTSNGYSFAKIQAAIDDETTEDGDTIWVCDGTYKEKITISKELFITSYNGKHFTFIETPSAVFANVNILESNVSIHGFSFISDAGNNTSIQIGDYYRRDIQAEKIIISNNSFYKNNISIRTYYCNSLELNNNSFYNPKKSIIINDKIEKLNILYNTFYSGELRLNYFQGATGEKWIIYGNNFEIDRISISMAITEMIFSKNKFRVAGLSNILKIEASGNEGHELFLGTLYSGNIDGNTVESFTLYETGLVYVSKNRFSEGETRLTKCLDAQIFDNIFSNQSSEIDLSANLLIKENTFTNCEKGIIVKESIDVTLKNNCLENCMFAACFFNSDNIKVSSNTINKCKLSLMVENSRKVTLEKNTLSNNFYGIHLINTFNTDLLRNVLQDNGSLEYSYEIESDYKILFHNINYGDQIFELNKNAGIFLWGSYHTNIIDNTIIRSCTGIESLSDAYLNIQGNYIQNSLCLFTGINLKNSKGIISGNTISNNNGNGIFLSNQSDFIVQNNNLFGNKPYGLISGPDNPMINANNNFWGTGSGPQENSFSGTIEVDSWLDSSVKLNVIFLEDEKYSPDGKSDSVIVFIQNLTEINDTIHISISDSKGWHTGEETFDIQFDDSTGTSLYIPYEIPAGLLDSSLFTVTAHSHLDNSWQATGQIPVFSYHPVADSIVVLPDSVAFSSADTVQFETIVYDQQRNYMEPELEWQASFGTIDSTGTYNSNGQTGVCIITATAKETSVSGQAIVRIWEGNPVAGTFTIDPGSATLYPGAWQFFDVTATDDQGFRVEASNLAWSATSGEINDFGIFTADTLPGYTQVVVADTINSISDTAYITVTEATIIEPRPAPELISPLNGETLNTLDAGFEWEPDSEAGYFVFELATDENFENPVEFIGIKENTLAQSGLEEGTSYFWHVKTVNDAGSGEWSETWQFGIETDDTTFVNGLSKNLNANIFPNPVDEILYISFDHMITNPVNIQLLSLDARVIHSGMASSNNNRTASFPMKGITPGIYMIRMDIGEEVLIRKVVKK